MRIRTTVLYAAFLPLLCGSATCAIAAESASVVTNRQLLVVAPGYWHAGDAFKFSFDVFDLDAGGKRIHRADPGKVGEIRGICASPVTQRLYVSGHEGLLCYDWLERKLLWRLPVEGEKANQNDAITVTTDGKKLYTLRHFSKGMNVYDANDGKRLHIIHEDKIKQWGRFSQVSHDGKRLYASSGDIFLIDPENDTILSRFRPLAEPVRFALSSDGKRFVYATGGKRSLTIHDVVKGNILHDIPVPTWEGAVTEKASVGWMALSPDGSQAWVCDPANACLHKFDLASDPPRYVERVATEKGIEGLMFSVDGRFLVTGEGAALSPKDGKSLGHLCDETGKPCPSSNSMMALETDAATGRILRTNQQCAPAWPGQTLTKGETAR